MTTILVWPPLEKEAYGGGIGAKAYFGWFFGHCSDRIIIPVAKDYKTDVAPEYISVASLWDSHKVELTTETQFNEPVDIVLMRSADMVNTPAPVDLKKMLGSQPVKNVQTSQDATAKYYYIGTPDTDLQDAYHCVCFSYWHFGGEDKAFLQRSRDRVLKEKIRAARMNEVAVFGTGPSVNEALSVDFSNSYSIVCNTIVKNRSFLAQMNLGFIVASDAHFHFSFHRYSARFLSDTLWALQNSGALFLTFDKFAAFIRYRVPDLDPYICGIPAGRSEYGFDLDNDFRVYPGESVLNMFLLPLAMFLGDKVDLCGFTGRSKTDSFFWGHSDIHQYAELMPTVRHAHPAFFANRDYTDYGDTVDQQVTQRVLVGRGLQKDIAARTTSFYGCFQ